MEAGAWPFLVGGVICLVKSDNERDLILLNSAGNGEVFGPSTGRVRAAPGGPGFRKIVRRTTLLRETLGGSSADGSLRQKQVCDAARCPGLHARYTAVFNERRI